VSGSTVRTYTESEAHPAALSHAIVVAARPVIHASHLQQRNHERCAEARLSTGSAHSTADLAASENPSLRYDGIEHR